MPYISDPNKYSKVPKPPILVNKQTQAFEKEYIFEFKLTFPNKGPRLQTIKIEHRFCTHFQNNEVILFANSESNRKEWVKHLQNVFETTLINILNRTDSGDEAEEDDLAFTQSKAKTPEMKKRKRKEKLTNKIGVLLPQPDFIALENPVVNEEGEK